MSLNRLTVRWPGPARLTLALLAVIPAAMAYPWPSTPDRWVLGVAVVVVIVVLGWWRGLHFTTMLRRRLTMLRRNRSRQPASGAGAGTRATAVLRIAPPDADTDADVLPLALLAGYLDRYGIRAESIQVTSRDSDSGTGAPRRDTWLGLTLSAADNLAALQARSSRVPLHQTAEVAARRLADHLRETGWQVNLVRPDDVPAVVAENARETWRAVTDGDSDYVAAYRIPVDAALSGTLVEIWSRPAVETWTVVQIAGSEADHTLAAACAFRTGERPRGAPPLAGLTPQRGNHRAVLEALSPLGTRRLDGHAGVDSDALASVHWPASQHRGGAAASTAPRRRHAAV